MEIRLTTSEAVRMFDIWYRELSSAAPATRAVESGAIKLDTFPSRPGVTHDMSGATVIVWYRAANAPTARAIQEASEATRIMNLPRQLYTGKLIDILKGQDETVYFKVLSLTRRSSDDNRPAYRSFNPSKGQLIEMVINPSAETVAAAGGTLAPSIQAPAPTPAPAPAPTVVPPGVAVRRTNP